MIEYRKNVIAHVAVRAVVTLMLLAGGTSAQSPFQKKVDSLFVVASSGGVKYRDMVKPAKDSIAALGARTVPLLVEKFTTKSARERVTIIQILKQIGSAAVPDLINSLGRPEWKVVKRICWALGDIGDSSGAAAVIEVLPHSSWQVREYALRALGKMGAISSRTAVIASLSDDIGQVRKGAAVAAGELRADSAIPLLVQLLDDEFYGARMTAMEALLKLDTVMVIAEIDSSLNTESVTLGTLSCRILGHLATQQAIDILFIQTHSSHPSRRAAAAEALIAADPEDNCDFRDQFLSIEKDKVVLVRFESALKNLKVGSGQVQ